MLLRFNLDNRKDQAKLFQNAWLEIETQTLNKVEFKCCSFSDMLDETLKIENILWTKLL